MSGPSCCACALLLVLAGASSLPWLAASGAAAQVAAEPEVLDLAEAAALLRVKPETIRDLAESGRIPARRVGDAWRFWRLALLEWLKGDAVPLTAEQMDSVNGRGPAPAPPSAQQQAPPPNPQVPAPKVGERPTTPTTEEIALRDQRVLLRRGSGTLDFSASYGRIERTLLPVVRVEDRTLGVNGTLRYGLLNDFQATLRVPRLWRRTTTFSDAAISGANSPIVTRQTLGGDATISLLRVLWRESEGRPTVVWSADGVVPTGAGERGFGGGLVLSKSYDPAVLFGGVSYLHGLATNRSNSNLSLAKHNYGAQVGYVYALNDTLALSTVLVGAYRNFRSVDGRSIPPPRENYALQFGSTLQLARGLFLEPAIAMRLGGDSPGLTLLFNISRSFQIRTMR